MPAAALLCSPSLVNAHPLRIVICRVVNVVRAAEVGKDGEREPNHAVLLFDERPFNDDDTAKDWVIDDIPSRRRNRIYSYGFADRNGLGIVHTAHHARLLVAIAPNPRYTFNDAAGSANVGRNNIKIDPINPFAVAVNFPVREVIEAYDHVRHRGPSGDRVGTPGLSQGNHDQDNAGKRKDGANPGYDIGNDPGSRGFFRRESGAPLSAQIGTVVVLVSIAVGVFYAGVWSIELSRRGWAGVRGCAPLATGGCFGGWLLWWLSAA